MTFILLESRILRNFVDNSISIGGLKSIDIFIFLKKHPNFSVNGSAKINADKKENRFDVLVKYNYGLVLDSN